MDRLFLVILMILCVPTQLLLSAQIFQQDDLNRLAQENNYAEYFDHALDIRPSLRNKLWTQTTEQMGQDYLAYLKELSSVKTNQFELVHRISQWNKEALRISLLYYRFVSD